MIVEMAPYHTHTPVLLKRSIELLITDPEGIYIDATLGGGGHTEEILQRTGSGARIYGVDQDPEALSAAGMRCGGDPRFHALEGNFGFLSSLLPPETKGKVNGILFDLGVSTHQLREPGRGFSFQQEGPLDMRMGAMASSTAKEVVNDYSYEKLRDLIFHYGEERLSRPIARAIVAARPIETTAELRQAVGSAVSGPRLVKSLARVFQAIRIEVNRELDMLRSALDESLQLLAGDGRIVAISYHSLEDRIVKTFFRTGNHEGKLEKDFYGNDLRPIEPLFRKAIRPSPEEVASNPAARSARLRAARKIEREV